MSSAGVGIGTFYRHFPNRHPHVAEVYRHAIGQLDNAAKRLAIEHPPLIIRREWLMLFVVHLATKKIMAMR